MTMPSIQGYLRRKPSLRECWTAPRVYRGVPVSALMPSMKARSAVWAWGEVSARMAAGAKARIASRLASPDRCSAMQSRIFS